MKTFEKKGWFRLSLPDDWEVDEDEEPAAIYHPQGHGALQVTAQAPRPLKAGEKIDPFLMLRGYLRAIGVDADEVEARRSFERGLDWAACEYASDSAEEGRVLFRAWLVTNHDIVAFLTYACPEEEKDAERSVVDGIVKSLELL